MTCPNIDGRVATGGCIYCNRRSFSPSRRQPIESIPAQIDVGIRRLQRRYRCDHFLAYFQPATNTYAPVDRLESVFQAALQVPQIVGLAIGTRPDCVPPPVLNLIERLGRQTYVSVEYGMQTIDDRLLNWINRGHDHRSFVDAVKRSRNRGFRVCAHVILGLPGQSREDVCDTAREVARLGLDGVKIHNLYAVRDTPLADLVRDGSVCLMSQEEYVGAVVDFLEWLPPYCVVERISGDAPPSYLVGPSWCLEKQAVRAAVEAQLEARDTYQSRLYSGAPLLRWPPLG
jgi:radical SAM protein (TIGR01212 family)